MKHFACIGPMSTYTKWPTLHDYTVFYESSLVTIHKENSKS